MVRGTPPPAPPSAAGAPQSISGGSISHNFRFHTVSGRFRGYPLPPLRIDFPCAIYYVTARGDQREPIHWNEVNRHAQLDVLAQPMDRFDAQGVLAACLSRLMRHLTMACTPRPTTRGTPWWGKSQRRRGWTVRACTVTCSDTHPVASAADTRHACARYAALVENSQARDATFWRDALQNEVYLGDENFVQRMQAQIHALHQHDKQIPKVPRRRTQSGSVWLAQCRGDRDQALYPAYQQGDMTMTPLGCESGLSDSRVGRQGREGEIGDPTSAVRDPFFVRTLSQSRRTPPPPASWQ